MNFRAWVHRLWPPVLLLLVLMVGFETAIAFAWIEEFILPRPSDVLVTIFEERVELLEAFMSTALAAGLGLFLSFMIGVVLATLLSLSVLLRRAIYPYAIFFQTVPIISIAPLLVIWFGFGTPTVIASAFVVSVFPVIASTLLGLQSTDPALVDLFRLYSATRRQVLLKLRLPFAAPQILSGLRIASGLAVIGAIVGEFIAGGGLGSVIDVARTQQRVDKVFAAVLISSLLGLSLVGLVNILNWFMLRHWHASAQKH